MSIAAVTVLVGVVLAGFAYGIAALRRGAREGVSTADVAAEQRRYLAAHWAEVEAAAMQGGMEADEVAVVRERLLGG